MIKVTNKDVWKTNNTRVQIWYQIKTNNNASHNVKIKLIKSIRHTDNLLISCKSDKSNTIVVLKTLEDQAKTIY